MKQESHYPSSKPHYQSPRIQTTGWKTFPSCGFLRPSLIFSLVLLLTLLFSCELSEPEEKIPRYQVIFDFNPISLDFYANYGDTTRDYVSVDEGQKVRKPEDPKVEKWVFSGWYREKRFESLYDFNTPVNNDLTLYAKWLETVTVTFDTVGGPAIASVELGQGTELGEPAKPSKEGFLFEGWYTDSAYTEPFSFATPIDSETTLHAKWLKAVTVMFDTVGRTEIASVVLGQGANVSEPAKPAKDGVFFAGWYTDSAYREPFSFATPINTDITLFAKWGDPAKRVMVTFNTGGAGAIATGQEAGQEALEKGDRLAEPVEPTRDGHRFDGWYSDASFATEFDFSAPINAHTTLHAKWVPRFTVSFDLDGGTLEPSSQVVDGGHILTEPVRPIRGHHRFDGWYSDASFATEFDFSAPINADTTLYAKWVLRFTVSFDFAGGTPEPNSQVVDKGYSLAEPVEPTRDGHRFDGWYSDASFATEFDFSAPINADTTLRAKWVPRFTVSFDLAGGTPEPSSQVVDGGTSGAKLKPKADPEKSGHTFLGWYIDNQSPFSDGTTITGDTTIYARFMRKSFQSIALSGVLPPKSELAAHGDFAVEILSDFADATSKELGVVYATENGGSTTRNGSSWEKAYAAAQLKTAIDNAMSSDQKPYLVLLAGGSYAISETLSMKNNVVIIGGFTEGGGWARDGATILDGQRERRIFHNTGLNDTARLYRVNISHGFSEYGSGMYNVDASPRLSAVTFSENKAKKHGGGMYNQNKGASPTLSHVTFSDNQAIGGAGGGMYNEGSRTTLSHVTFSDNQAIEGGGGGMHNRGTPFTKLSHVTFSGNKAAKGGGLFNYGAIFKLSHVTFSMNTARFGGGIYSSGRFYFPTLRNVTFSENTASDDGGGMYYEGDTITFNNVTFSVNTAGGSGGGMYINSSSPSFNNTSFFGNKAVDNGGGIYSQGNTGASLFIINSIFWGNTANANSQINQTGNIFHSIVEGATSVPARGLLAEDPQSETLQDNGGFVQTAGTGASSPGTNAGAYVQEYRKYKEGDRVRPEVSKIYYSEDGSSWKFFDTKADTVGSGGTPPADAEDLTATDARGYARTGRPDIGTYEFGGTAP